MAARGYECADRNAHQSLQQRDTVECINSLALIELLNGPNAPSYVAGTDNFYVVTRYNWSSFYAMAVIELAETVAREMPTNR